MSDQSSVLIEILKPLSDAPTPKYYVFKGKLREECQNRHAFANGRESQGIVRGWNLFHQWW